MTVFFTMRAGQIEKERSTVSYALMFFWQSSMIQLTYLILSLLIGLFYGPALETISVGIWPLYLWLITQDAVRNPNQGQSVCFFPFQIKAIYCPFIWLTIFTLTQGINSLPMYAGFIIGLLDGFDVLNFTYPSIRCIHNVENCSLIRKFGNSNSFVRYNDSIGI